MPDQPASPQDSSLRGYRLVTAVRSAATVEQALATILTTIRELTKADVILFIDRTPSGSLEVTHHASDTPPSPAELATALADATAALARHAAPAAKAAATGRPVRDEGTTETETAPSVAKVLWSGDKVFGVLSILGRRDRAFGEIDQVVFASLAESAATGLAKQFRAPPPDKAPRDAGFEAAKKRAATRRISRTEVDALATLAGKTFVGTGPAYRKLLERIQLFAAADLAVLILGESGTGKERAARLIHDAGPRRKGPFVAVNAGAVSASLFESLFFGHKKGAFTGAEKDAPGHVRRAEGGTLFLDEVGELTLDQQVKLLRVLQEKKVTPVGGAEEVAVDFRVVAATNQRLELLIAQGKFRQDLYYRLCALTIDLPPLRERLSELEVFVEHFFGRSASGVAGRTLAADAWAKLRRHAWPGNLRELDNVIQSALVQTPGGGPIRAESLEIRPLPGTLAAPTDARSVKTPAEVVAEHDGNVTQAAKALGIDRRTLQRKLRRES